MKRVSILEYLQKKNIVEDLDKGKYTSTIVISDEEFERINNKLDQYNLIVSRFNLPESQLTPEQQTLIINKLDALEQAINELRQVAYDSIDINQGTLDVTNIN